ncbi:MAG: hypothetical protein HQL97_11310 [Magnetococcales bacterium]|nr:hypothetical protein [Magnetococcales bacterium]
MTATGAVQGGSVTDGTNTLSTTTDTAKRAEKKADTVATYTTSGGAAASTTGNGSDISNAALKAVDAANAKATQTTTVGTLGTERDTGNVFLDFFKKLFGTP